jgi:hypothetical protein
MSETTRQAKAEKTATEKKPFVEPRMKFVEPEIVEAGEVAKKTKGFFGPFSP